MKSCRKIFFVSFFSLSFILRSYAQTPTFTLSVNKYEPNCELGAAKINVNGGTPPYYYQWSSGAVGDSVSSLNGGTYTVYVSDSNVQTPDTQITFDIAVFACKVFIESKFSPNGDGINDHWSITGWELYPKFLVEVFDRWGQLVYVQRGKYTPWDGTNLGVRAAEATYYYVFYYDEGKRSNIEKGSVTILR